MSEYIIGAHILESLTSGMYQDSRTIFREYIQNACDAIDDAVKQGLLGEGEGEIRITLEPENRRIVIKDNGTGIRESEFVRVMGSIADSDKSQRENKGFRGIGKLCGMAYCGTARFSAKFSGEGVVSRLTSDARTLREFFGDKSSGIERHSASEVLEMINEFTVEETEDVEGHYFCVELEEINAENEDLLSYEKVSEYLSFVAPLKYHVGFDAFRGKIHEHALGLGQRIDEYDVYLNGDELFKMYSPKFSTSMGDDEIFDVEFEDIRDDEGRLIAWMWYGISSMKARIKKDCPMWGIRLRKGNIQVGDAYTMQRFFQEDRGNRYFVGELFCVSDELIPNARRDYFNESPQCSKFERAVRECTRRLSALYKDGSALNSSYRKAKQAEQKSTELQYMLDKGYVADDESRLRIEEEQKQAQESASQEKSKFERVASKSDIHQKIAERIVDRKTYITRNTTNTTSARLTKTEQNLLGRVFGILREELGRTADTLIHTIEERLGAK